MGPISGESNNANVWISPAKGTFEDDFPFLKMGYLDVPGS